MAALELQALTVESARELFLRLASEEVEVDPNSLEIGDWAKIDVYLPKLGHSVITAAFMEAFLDIQRQVLQFAALSKYGVADIRQLSDADREKFNLYFVVSGGSSRYDADIRKVATEFLMELTKKMTGQQAVIVVLGLALVGASYWGWESFLENERIGRVEELKSQDHRAALEAMQFAARSQVDTFNKVLETLNKLGPEGRRAAELSAGTNDALLKAASKVAESQINGQKLEQAEAETLRKSTKRKPSLVIVQRAMRVIDINSQDPLNLQVILYDEESGDQFRLKFGDSLFAEQDRERLFGALDDRQPIWVELVIRELGGEPSSVELLRVIDPPKIAQP